MAMFPNLFFEGTVQVNDRTRLDASSTYVDKSEAALTSVEIEPEAAAGFISVFDTNKNNWFLDYQYATDGAKVVTVRVDNGSGPVTATFTINVLTAVDDYLFSTDQDLLAVRSDILKYLPEPKNSYLNVHRKAQELILANLDERGIVDNEGNKLDKADVVDISEVNEWSTYLTLKLIFEDLSNAVDDVFERDAKRYETQMLRHRDRSFLRLDLNNDGTIVLGEGVNVKSLGLIRR